ncbi:SDR family NAD(P)-dependent oxidoreductase [Pseudonocardia sp. ICBG1293]|uniref:SDR family NAD(P)-dependent oxidoreductase n=1 Tax=Pseudonocardia sp. ICBG1293 TaxID=2844382 RepID=UPI001CCEF7FE|nr:SDR family NAD(P)-dependent oxidoreductase [Pseudonocardia sp. ICBG1293]
MTRFDGKVAVVTGAAGDIGSRLCRALAAENAEVIGADVDEAAGARLTAEMHAAGTSFTFRHLDVADPRSVAAFARTVGRVDVLVNAAGVLSYAPLSETAVEEWDRVLDINVRGAFLVTKELTSALADGATVVNLSSSAAVRAGAGWSAYSASKAALVALTKVTAAELAPRCRVNAVCPGALDTRMPHRLLDGHPAKETILHGMAEASMLKRLGEADEVVPICLFLASEEAGLITGASIIADGGTTAW